MLALKIAWRYLFSWKTRNAVHFISLIALIGFMAGSFALIVVLSVFNGFGSIIQSMYDSYDPDIKIVPIHGKYIENPDSIRYFLYQSPYIDNYTMVCEENVLVKYGNQQTIANLKSADLHYFKVNSIAQSISFGNINYLTSNKSVIIGRGMAQRLGIDFSDYQALHIYIPESTPDLMKLENSFSEISVIPTHEFSLQQELDGKNIIISDSLFRELAGRDNLYTSVELKSHQTMEIKKLIQLKFPNQYKVSDRFEQHELLNKIMKSEKGVSTLILGFILIIISFNLSAGLIMLALEKKDNFNTLRSMGGTEKLISNIFIIHGMMICLTGSITGLFVGFFFCTLQNKYGFIPIGNSETMIITSYPVEFKISDGILVFFICIIIGLICSYIPARRALIYR